MSVEVYDSDSEQKWSVVHGLFSHGCTPVLFPVNVAVPLKPIPTSLHHVFQATQSTQKAFEQQ